MVSLLQQIINNPVASLLVVGNLILIESLLSIDNAAVLATMVMALPRPERKKALKYGIFGAYVARGICLFSAAFLIKVWWLKAIGGVYLIYLFFAWLKKRSNKPKDNPQNKKAENVLYAMLVNRIGSLWAAIISVELMDLAFSMDNVFAAVAFSNNIIIILCGVFIGMLAMRVVAQGFVKLMQRYPFLETCAYTVIGLLGIKLGLSFPEHFYPASQLSGILNGPYSDRLTSAVTICIFLVPVITSVIFNFPKRTELNQAREK